VLGARSVIAEAFSDSILRARVRHDEFHFGEISQAAVIQIRDELVSSDGCQRVRFTSAHRVNLTSTAYSGQNRIIVVASVTKPCLCTTWLLGSHYDRFISRLEVSIWEVRSSGGVCRDSARVTS
jgi:hypothetical protein